MYCRFVKCNINGNIESAVCYFQDKFRGLKTAPEDSLTFFLAVCICIVYHSYGGEGIIFTLILSTLPPKTNKQN